MFTYYIDKINTVETISVSQSVVLILIFYILSSSLCQPGVKVSLEVREIIKVLRVRGVSVEGHDAVLVILLLPSHPVQGGLLVESLETSSQALSQVSLSQAILNRFLPSEAVSSSEQSFSQLVSKGGGRGGG